VPLSVVVVGSTDRQLEEILRRSGSQPTAIGADDLPRLVQAAVSPDIVLLDQRDRTALPAALPALKRQHPHTGVIVISPRLDPALMLEAMRAGVGECLVDPVKPADLDAAIRRLIAQRPAPAPGEIFAFIGSKGGVGTTTLAVNVATALAMTGQPTLFVDLHFSDGDGAVFFGAEPRHTVVDAIDNTHRLDDAFLHGLVTHTKAGPDLLAASEQPLLREPDVERMRAFLTATARPYRAVVLDCARTSTAVMDGLEPASRIVVVLTQELTSVRGASRLLSQLRQRYGRDRVTTVMVRYDPAAEIGQDDVARVIGGSVRHVMPSHYRIALDALNKGRPLVLENHSRLASQMSAFARELSGAGVKAAKQPPPGLLARWTGKR
jgi:pilus assembly protein CpaE